MEFLEIGLSERERLEGIRHTVGHTASSHAFVSLYLWRHAMSLSVAYRGEAFLVKSGEGYFFPCGKSEDVLSLVAAVWECEPDAVFLYARAEDVALVRSVYGEGITAEFDAASREYLYDREEQIAMPGKPFTYQRAKVNKARRLGETLSVELTEAHRETAKAITRLWAERREDEGDLAVTLEALDSMEALSLYGNLLLLDSQPIGFNLGSFLAPHIFDIHIAKTLRDDVDTLMKLELYKALPERVTVINREEDLGIRGLAIHKQDGKPSGFNDTYRIFSKGKE